MLRSPWLPTWLVCCVVLPAQSRLFEPADLPARAKAAAAVQTLLAAPGAASATASGAAAAAAMLPEGSAARQRLDAALQAFHAQPAATATDTTLRLALDDLLEVLTFRPISQAPLPAGFPGFQVVDEIELRTYPKSRLVTTSLAGGSNRAFWPLFRHIEDNGIAMTTPVQMDWTPGTLTDSRPARMAFLYGDPERDAGRTSRGVEVVDVASCTVLSIGAIGEDRRERVAVLAARLVDRLQQDPAWVAAGPIRTMGYNSPMVPRDQRYFEVQLPILKRPDNAADASRR